MLILCFRILLLAGFLAAAWKWGDWRNWQKYYPTMLFVMTVNLSAGYITYHHPLWVFNPDALVGTKTVVEFLNTYLVLPATALIYLSNFRATGRTQALAYIFKWVLIYGSIEFIDHRVVGGLSYANGWSFKHSLLFDWAMFAIIRMHYMRPLLGWLAFLAGAAIILAAFDFGAAEIK